MAYTLDELKKMGAKPVTKTEAPSVSYTLDDLKKMGAKTVAPPAETSAPEEKEDGILKKIIKAPIESLLVKPAARAAEAIGRTGAFGSTIKKGYEEMAETGQQLDIPLVGKYDVEAVKPGVAGAKQIAGEALEAASYVPIGAGAAKVGQTAFGTVARTTVPEAIKTGAKTGAVAGSMFGGGEALQEDGSVSDVATGAFKGALTGAAVGGATGGALQAFGNKMSSNAVKSAETKTMLETKVPDSRVATKILSEEGKVVNDKVALEAVRQGIPEADVALIKGGSAADKAKMLKMLDVRQNQLTNKRVTYRATDVVGDTFVNNIAKPIEKLNKEAANTLDEVARGLAGKKVDTTPAVNSFVTALDRAGVKVTKRGLNFKGSDFEGLKGAQTLINNVWNRALKVHKTGDAFQAHRAKRYIDEIVNYGKRTEGLSGRAEGMLKQFRHSLDGVLDVKFPGYNAANIKYAETITELDKMGAAIGKSFKLGDTFADAQSGLAMRRILSNTQSRSEILQLLDGMQKVAKKYGIEIEDDVITQANFADLLEKMLGTEAPTSMLGQTERAIESLGGAGAELSRGNLISGTIKAGKYAFDVTRGINQENKINALRELLRVIEKPPKRSVFGRP